MKKYLFMAVALVMGAVCLTSCGDDDDDLKLKAGISENGNTLTLSYSNSIASCTEVATFDDNDVCVKYITTETYSNKDDADRVWAEETAGLDEEELASYNKNGKTITIDETKYYEGDTRAEVRQYMESILAEIQQINNGQR